MDQIILTEPQQRHLRASLLSFEKALRLADRLLNEGDEVGILYSRKLSLDSSQRSLGREKIAKTFYELSKLVEQLGFKPEEEKTASTILSEMSVSWANLVDCQSDRMKGYGEVDMDTAKIIDPAIDRLEKMALELSNLFSSDMLDRMLQQE